MSTHTLHIALLDKFIPPFIDFIRKNFSDTNQKFFTYGDIEKYQYDIQSDSYHVIQHKFKIIEFLIGILL